MRKIIALYGTANRGKTSTLLNLINHLKMYYFCEKEMPINSNDICAIFLIKNKRIGISTIGDVGYEVSKEINYLMKLSCDLIFTATRTKGTTVDETQKLGDINNYDITWVAKTYVVDDEWPNVEHFRDRYNKLDMEYLLEYIINSIE